MKVQSERRKTGKVLKRGVERMRNKEWKYAIMRGNNFGKNNLYNI